jgi:outer membrane protein assembly complex protein YaeT
MTARRRACRRTLPPAATAAALLAVLLWARGGLSADSPAGKVIADVVPVNNKVRSAQQIKSVIHTRAGRPYDEGVAQEDVRRLHATKWFTPGGVQIHTKNEPDGRVTVFVYVTELTSTVQEIVYVGADHLSPKDLQELTGVRKGEPMNPLANELGRAAVLRRYQEDGRYHASVELVEGNKPTDTRVVYHIVEGPMVKVDRVLFSGNERSGGRLRQQLATKRTFLGLGGKFNPMSLDADRQKLLEYYHALGFLKAQITPEVIPSADLTTVTIVYHVEEGPPHVVAGRQIDGNATFGTDQLNPLVDLKPGERYDERTVQRDLIRLRNYYGYRGYAVGLEKQLYEVPGQPGVVQVHYQVLGDKGEPDRVGQVQVRGNEVTKQNVILRQLGPALRPGQVLQYPEVEAAEARLNRLGIFDAENRPRITVVQNEFDSPMKDLIVEVQETRTGQFMIGGSVNSNAGLNGSIVLNERNFDITRIPTSWDDFRYGRAFRGAGQEFRLEAAPGTQFQRYSATWREPYLFDSKFGLTDSIYYFNRQYVEYTEDRVGDRITLDRRLGQNWRMSGSLRVEGVNVRDTPWYAGPEITDDKGWHTLVGLRAGLTRDTRDSFIYPTTGSVLDVGVEQVMGSYEFPIATGEYTKFFSSTMRPFQREDGSGKHVLAVRSQVAFEGGNAPVFERFYAGGFRSLRGFTFRGVGPIDANGLFVGGTFSFLNTVEYMFPVLPSDKLHMVAFIDHGTVERSVEIKDYRVSAGFGFRINVPQLSPLPIALDFAFPINKAPWDNRQLFSFYVGVFGGP